MALVQHKGLLSFCIDETEYTESGSIVPKGYQNRFQCEAVCSAQKKRLPTQAEWIAACEGTDPEKCNIHGVHPVVAKLNQQAPWVRNGLNCKDPKNTWGLTCMNDPSLNEISGGLAAPMAFSGCISRFGVYDMVGNLGEWVSTPKGQFSGGLYPQDKSSCQYSTTAHQPNYSDYSIGCRCAADSNE